jgi:hypothetical protein
MVGSCECINEPSGTIKAETFFEYLRGCKLLRKDSAALSCVHNCVVLCCQLLQPVDSHTPVSSVEALKTENGLLKNELRSSNTELSLLLHRTKTAEKG